MASVWCRLFVACLRFAVESTSAVFFESMYHSVDKSRELSIALRQLGNDWLMTSIYLWNHWRLMLCVQSVDVNCPLPCETDIHCVWRLQLRLLHVQLSGLADPQFVSAVFFLSGIGIDYSNRSIWVDFHQRVRFWLEEMTAEKEWTGKALVSCTEKLVCLHLLMITPWCVVTISAER